jgi:hypothetical protein
MKPVFKSTRCFGKQSALMLAAGLLALPWAAVAQPIDTYHSPPVVNSAPNVNATNFVNTGQWNISSSPLLPYQTFSTYNYTNTGSMYCTIGWQFDHGPYPVGGRGWSANFFNDTPGIIVAQDGGSSFVSSLLVRATNIVNKGTLSAGPYGSLQLLGSSVNLARSGLEITALLGQGTGNGQTNFAPDTAIYDLYWRGGTNGLAFPTNLWNGKILNSPVLNNVGQPCDPFTLSFFFGSQQPQVAVSYTNNLNPMVLVTTNGTGMPDPPITIYSNQVRQAIFVYSADPDVAPYARFGQSIGISNIFLPMAVALNMDYTDPVTGSQQSSTVYVVDDLAAVGTNGTLLFSTFFNPNASCQQPTYRPDSVTVSRSDDGTFGNGSTGNGGWPTNTFFFQPNFSNTVANGRADLYVAQVDNLVTQLPAGVPITDAPGRIQISAKDLNLNKARISAAGVLVIQASNLVSSAGAVIDCQNLSFNLGATNGNLNVTNLAPQSVSRLNGTVYEWSGFWTNYQVNVYTNYILDMTTSNYVRADYTNVVEMDLALTFVYGALGSTIPVNVLDLVLHSTNMVVSDTMTVDGQLLFDGQSLTVNGGVILTDPLVNWDATTTPTLRYFTNNGTLQIPETADFGTGGTTNYAVFVNNGSISAGTETINSALFLNGGSQSVSGGLFVTTLLGRVENANIDSSEDVQFTAGVLKFTGTSITAGDQLYFAVAGSLFDAGGTSGNFFTCYNGFNLAVKPASGDLLGTALETITPTFGAVNHYWSGLDLGAVPAGFSNNVAVGQFVLSEGTDSEFNFSATGASNAIYADLLDLSQCPDYLDPEVLTIDTNFVIYYAAVTGVTVPQANDPEGPEEYLNGQLGGHLVWVPGFAGPNSSVDCVVNGKTVKVNSALRFSKIIDSNGNGIPNYYDLNPFDPPPVVLSGSVVVNNNPPPASKFAISWTASANAVYQVQYSTNLSPTVWTPLQNYTNNSSSNVLVTVYDTNGVAGRRFYRVSHP